MKRRLRLLVTFASVLALVMVLNVGTAFAHGNGATGSTFPGGANNNAAILGDVDPLFFNGAIDAANGNASFQTDGVVEDRKGFTLHSPMCSEHYETGH